MMKDDITLPCGAYGLMFHYFHDGNRHQASQGSISVNQFETILDKLEADHILSAHEWDWRAENGCLNQGEICLTFDDGLRCQYDIALPALRRRGITAFWFVNSSVLKGKIIHLEVFRRFRNEYFSSIDDFYQAFFSKALSYPFGTIVEQALNKFPDEYLSEFSFYTKEDRMFRYIRDKILKQQEYVDIMNSLMQSMGASMEDLSNNLWLERDHLRTLESEGHIIGLHSHSHPTGIAGLPKEKQRLEYQMNFNILRDILIEPPFTMAHPYNSYSSGTLEILQNLGIRIGFRSNTHKTNYSILELPREDSANLING